MGLPNSCPHCGTMHTHEGRGTTRIIRNGIKFTLVNVPYVKCPRCDKTFWEPGYRKLVSRYLDLIAGFERLAYPADSGERVVDACLLLKAFGVTEPSARPTEKQHQSPLPKERNNSVRPKKARNWPKPQISPAGKSKKRRRKRGSGSSDSDYPRPEDAMAHRLPGSFGTGKHR